MDVLSLIGRLHPMVLHLPIGIFMFVFFMELYARFKQTSKFTDAIGFGLLLAAFFASISCLTGWLLSDSGDYAGDLVWYHKWGAIIFTAFSWILYAVHGRSKSYFPLLCFSILGLTYVGHQGASLTHGADFLWASDDHGELNMVNADELIVYQNLIQPILKKKCQSCHNGGKKKGQLDMSSYAAMLKGGENGAAFMVGSSIKSLMINRIHLPMDDKEHMPPESKKQLSEDEISLLQWWIDQGASEKALLKDLEKDDDIKDILKKYTVNASMAKRPSVDRLEDNVLSALIAKGIPVNRLSKESPFVAVDLSHKNDITKSQIKKLNKLEDQLVDLDLAFANVDDASMKSLADLNHVERLELQGTQVTTQGMKSLGEWKSLKVLNLYNTKVDDGFLGCINQFPSLQRLYLWQSKMSSEAVDSLVKMRPLVDVQFSLDEEVFGDSRLLPPKIIADADLFTDSLNVALQINFQNVDIRYTLDGSDPTANSLKYEDEITLKKTSILKAICMKEGWEQSEVGTKQFVLASMPFKSAKLKKQPSDKYAARGARSLIDLVKGSEAFTDGTWLGFEGEGLEVVLDLGENQRVTELTVGALEATASYIFFPRGISAYTSMDGVSFNLLAREKYPEPLEGNQGLKNYILKFSDTETRYVKVIIDGQVANPEWHAAPGAKSWLFVDEIVVN